MSAYLFAGCARSAEERHLDEMRAQIDHLENVRDRADAPVLAPEPGDSVAPHPSAAHTAPAPAIAPGAVTIGESAGEPQDDDYADTQDPAPRPSIRVLGSPRGSRNAWRGEDRVEETTTGAGTGGSDAAPIADENANADPSAGGVSAIDPAAKRAYDAALSLVTSKQYGKALDALAAFLMKWPDHPYANNAMFWRGECYFARGEYPQAADQFEGVLARFPAGSKAPDALLALGRCRQKLGDPARAKDAFDRLAQQFPQSDAARHIPSVTASVTAQPAPPSGAPQENHR